MDINNLIKILQTQKVYLLPETQLEELLESCTVVLEKDTLISGFIRILNYNTFFLTQEISTKKEIVLRLFKNRKDADALVYDHLETYDKMWDGCGCKVNYYS